VPAVPAQAQWPDADPSVDHEVPERIAVPEERMKTLQPDLQGTPERFRADMTRRDTDMARRDRDNLRRTVGFGVAQIAATIAVLAAGLAFLALVGIPAK